MRVLRGFPITVGLAAAFVIMFVSVPVMRVAALVRKQKSADIPLIMNASAYHEVAAKLCEVLNRQGFSLHAAEPGFWVSAPIRLLVWFGGDVLRSHVPTRLEHYVGPDLALSLYPSGLVLRGQARTVYLGARARRRGRRAHRRAANDRSEGAGAGTAAAAAVEKL